MDLTASNDLTWIVFIFIGAFGYFLLQFGVDKVNKSIRNQREGLDSVDYYISYFTEQIQEGYAEVVEELAEKMPEGIIKESAQTALWRYENKV